MNDKRTIKISGWTLNECSRDRFFTKVVGAALIVKANYVSSTIKDFSINKFRKLLHCSYVDAQAIYKFAVEEGYAHYRTTNTGRRDLCFAPLHKEGEELHKKASVSYVNICNSEGGVQIYLTSGAQDMYEKYSRANTTQTLHTITNLLEKIIIGRSIIHILRNRSDRQKSDKLTMHKKEAALRDEIAKQNFNEKRKSPIEAMRLMNKSHLHDQPALRAAFHYLYDNTRGHEYSMYSKDGITLEALAKYAFGGTRSVKTVQRLLDQMYKEDRIVERKRHGNPVILMSERGSDLTPAFTNALGEACSSFKCGRLKYAYNQKHTEEIEKDTTKACYQAFMQPWANSYDILSADFVAWKGLKRA